MFKIHAINFLLLGLFGRSNAQCDTPSVTTVLGTHAPTGIICPGQIIFEDNFDEFNLDVWNHESTLWGGGNWEFQWYTNSRYNSYVENGVLYIKPTLVEQEPGADPNYIWSGVADLQGGAPADECTNPADGGCWKQGNNDDPINPVKSARIRTVYSFAFKYGSIEVSAKLPSGDWLWPAIWLLPRLNQYSGWPVSGEIDLMESRGNRQLIGSDGKDIGKSLVGQTLHWGPRYDINYYMMTHWEVSHPPGYDDDFHRYRMDWSPNGISFFVDDQQTGRVDAPAGGFYTYGNVGSSGFANPWVSGNDMAPFDREFYILINLALGGTSYFPDDAANGDGPKPWGNNEPHASGNFIRGQDQWLPTWNLATDQAALKIDYVRVTAL